MRRLIAACVCAGCISLGTGCAALSLFGQHHDHVHHHGCDFEGTELTQRLDSIERQLSRLNESSGTAVVPAVATEQLPTP